MHIIIYYRFQTRRTTRRSLAAARIKVSSDNEAPPGPVRRSQRARTPTRYFLSELHVPTRRRRSVTPKPAKKEVKAEKNPTEDEEEEEEEEDFEVDRSEYELRSHSHTTPRKSPRRHHSTHYFNSELPQPWPHHLTQQQTDGKGENTEVSSSYKLQSTTTTHSVATSTALSSDEELGGAGETAVTPRISLFESKMRKQLSDLSSTTRKMVSEALASQLSAVTSETAPPPAKELSQPRVQPAHSQRPKAPTLSSPHVYETRSRTTQSQQTQPSQPAVTRMRLCSNKTPVLDQNEKEKATQPSITTPQLSQEPQPSAEWDDTPPQPYPQWMELGWEEVILALIIVGLLIFAYYCFYSDGC